MHSAGNVVVEHLGKVWLWNRCQPSCITPAPDICQRTFRQLPLLSRRHSSETKPGTSLPLKRSFDPQRKIRLLSLRAISNPSLGIPTGAYYVLSLRWAELLRPSAVIQESRQSARRISMIPADKYAGTFRMKVALLELGWEWAFLVKPSYVNSAIFGYFME